MTDLAQRMMMDASLSRTEQAALAIGQLAEQAPHGARLGTKKELQEQCGVAKGTFNEALRILQSRGVITVRSGPGGGLFAASPTPIARLGNSILSLDAAEGDVADAVRIRDALDPLLIEDALDHSSAVDITRMRTALDVMRQTAEAGDATGFVRANWELHSAIARVSPNAILKSIYLSLLDLIESHTVSVEPVGDRPLPEYIAERQQLHVDLVDALDRRDRDAALRLIHAHNTTQHEPEAARVHTA
ncbi:FadR family transcriptional regulator [Rhodococcus pseudokoreensis]|uniref:FadR family transcriptional regulator n=1 Tax=Rhodococcus pseudokoreensis TaxID=2811421 RepID=A0A974WDS7_9NOCA|nr:FCD domain-containing protein [Rhodococcus pseudokoreensis]QSE95075.1 FadR family transcriptional regulator [Rhodococcus pseudokoreensis]